MSLTGKPHLTSADPVPNDGFWPELAVADLMSKYRIPSEYADDTILWGLSLAVIRVNESLDRVKTELKAQSFATFEAYLNDAETADAELLSVQYQHAVYARAKALLLQQFMTMNRRASAENEAKESAHTEQFWLDESQHAIAGVLRRFFPGESFVSNGNVRVASL